MKRPPCIFVYVPTVLLKTVVQSFETNEKSQLTVGAAALAGGFSFADANAPTPNVLSQLLLAFETANLQKIVIKYIFSKNPSVISIKGRRRWVYCAKKLRFNVIFIFPTG